MCAQDKALIKKTFHDIKDFITSGSSRLPTSEQGGPSATGGEAGVVPGPPEVPVGPLPPRGSSRPPIRTYGRSRGSSRTGMPSRPASQPSGSNLSAGGGAGVVPGPPEVPVGPLPLLSTSLLTATPRQQQHEQQQQPPQLAQHQPQPFRSVP